MGACVCGVLAGHGMRGTGLRNIVVRRMLASGRTLCIRSSAGMWTVMACRCPNWNGTYSASWIGPALRLLVLVLQAQAGQRLGTQWGAQWMVGRVCGQRQAPLRAH